MLWLDNKYFRGRKMILFGLVNKNTKELYISSSTNNKNNIGLYKTKSGPSQLLRQIEDKENYYIGEFEVIPYRYE